MILLLKLLCITVYLQKYLICKCSRIAERLINEIQKYHKNAIRYYTRDRVNNSAVLQR